jgi:long-chain acyl-CoA synthetase
MASTIPELLLARVDRAGNDIAFYVKAEHDLHGMGQSAAGWPGWNAYTFRDCLRHGSGLVRRLAALGVGRGVKVAILAETSYLWSAVDLATLCLGGVTVGIYPTLLADQVLQQLEHSEAHLLVVEDEAQHRRLMPRLAELEGLRHVYSLQPCADLPQLSPAEPDEAFLRAQAAKVRPDDLATIVYTSGTTGDSKGVMLSHRNFTATIEASRRAIPTHAGDRSILFLPLAHSLQRFALYRGLAEDATGFYCPRLSEMPQVIPAARPHVLASVPRMLEKIKATAEAKAAERSPRAARLLQWAVDVGRARNHLLRRQRPVPLRLAAQHALAERLIYQTVRQRLGGELRLLVSGGAALSVEVMEWYEAMGISVREGWGLTETCAPATSNRLERYKPGTVGLPLPGVEVKLDADGELLVRGPGNFIGYYKDPAATAAATTAEGYFRTGDIGHIDQDGFISIVDRKKELLVTAGGKNVAPAPIEKALEGGLVGQAVVVGSERPFLVALLALDPELLQHSGLEAGSPVLRRLLQQRVEDVNATLPRYAQLKAWALLPGPLTVETGELTATLKLRRRAILSRHQALIDGLYGASGHQAGRG